MKRPLLGLVLAFFTFPLCTMVMATAAEPQSSVQLPKTASDWAKLAHQDIEAAYQITAENHPAVAAPLNPHFRRQLLQARTNALLLDVKDAYSYEAAIDRFSASLRDGHAGAFATLPHSIPTIRRWPGFIVAWRGDAFWVYYSEQPGVNAGMQLISCDGQSAEQLMKDRVFAYTGQPDQPGHWWSYSRRLLLDDGNPFNSPIQQCQLRQTNNEIITVTLTWRPRPESVMPQVEAATNGDKLPVALSWPHAQVAWIAMPTFSPDPADIKNYEKLFTDLQQQRPKLLEAKAIVLDLRHNQGGSSYWSTQVAFKLWGKQRVEHLHQALFSKTKVWWYASAGNTAFVVSLYDVLKAQGQTQYLPWIKSVGQGMQQALQSGQPFYIDDSEADIATTASTPQPPELTTPVYVVMPGQCASACLDALDTFRLFSNTKLIGATSSADSTYMEVRLQPLPSGLGQVIIPTKVYIDRPRANGQYIEPDLAHHDLEWSSASFLQKILADLKR